MVTKGYKGNFVSICKLGIFITDIIKKQKTKTKQNNNNNINHHRFMHIKMDVK
jgi:hypothetical protein